MTFDFLKNKYVQLIIKAILIFILTYYIIQLNFIGISFVLGLLILTFAIQYPNKFKSLDYKDNKIYNFFVNPASIAFFSTFLSVYHNTHSIAESAKDSIAYGLMIYIATVQKDKK